MNQKADIRQNSWQQARHVELYCDLIQALKREFGSFGF